MAPVTLLAEGRPDPRQKLGRKGETLAEDLLVRLGMRVVARNFRRRLGEIDLIAEDGGILVFVEVKTRRGIGYGVPAASVTARKREHLARTALAYLQATGQLERTCRFDVVEVLRDRSGEHRLNHIRDAFRLWPTG